MVSGTDPCNIASQCQMYTMCPHSHRSVTHVLQHPPAACLWCLMPVVPHASGGSCPWWLMVAHGGSWYLQTSNSSLIHVLIDELLNEVCGMT